MKFSSGEKEVIERKLEVSSDSKSNKRDRFEFYEISRCVDVINRRDFQKVNIQQLLTWTATDFSLLVMMIIIITIKLVFTICAPS